LKKNRCPLTCRLVNSSSNRSKEYNYKPSDLPNTKEQLLKHFYSWKVEEEYRDHMAYMQARQEKEMRDLVERHRYIQK
jgi:hypothetical protein